MYLLLKSLWFALVYILGSIPFGLVLGRVFCGIDIRNAGSGNVGATNVARLCGTRWGVLTLLLDAAKGAVPVAVALYVLPHFWPEMVPAKDQAFVASFTALAAILGHLYSAFLKFKGGKAVATTVGVYLVLLPVHLIIAAGLCVAVIKRWGFVSLGSITLVSAMPALLVFSGMFTRNFEYFLPSICIAALVIYNHRGNIMRLMAGEEKPWQKRNAPEQPDADAGPGPLPGPAPAGPGEPKTPPPGPASDGQSEPKTPPPPGPASNEPPAPQTATPTDAGPACGPGPDETKGR